MSAGKRVVTTIAVVACGLLAIAATADASQAANRPANSKVTIKSWPRLYGYVKSPVRSCAKHRKIAVFSQSGSKPHPATDKRIATAVARHFQGTYQWITHVDSSGTFYAKARHRPGCDVAFSRTVHVSPRAGDYPVCPGKPGDLECVFTHVHFDSDWESWCTNYLKHDTGECGGASIGGPPTFQTCSPFATFHWVPNPSGRSRDVAYRVDTCETHHRAGYIEGFVNNDSLRRYFATDLWGDSNPDQHFCSPNPPLWDAQAGEAGGPLELDFQNGVIGADVYIQGFLVAQGHGFC